MTRRKLKNLPATFADKPSAIFWGILLTGLKPEEVELLFDGRGDELPADRVKYANKHWEKIERGWVEGGMLAARKDGE